MKENDCSQIVGTIAAFTWRAWGNNLVRTAGLLTGNWTRHFPNERLKCYPLDRNFRWVVCRKTLWVKIYKNKNYPIGTDRYLYSRIFILFVRLILNHYIWQAVIVLLLYLPEINFSCPILSVILLIKSSIRIDDIGKLFCTGLTLLTRSCVCRDLAMDWSVHKWRTCDRLTVSGTEIATPLFMKCKIDWEVNNKRT
jgi:hypothetical protein